MPQCPKCKTEYSINDKVCAKCGQGLNQEGEVFLTSASSGFEADMLEGSLRTASIPYIKKGHSGPAGFARYDTSYDSRGNDFYVPAALLERAKKLLPDDEDAVDENEPDMPADEVSDTSEAGEIEGEGNPSENSESETPGKQSSPMQRTISIIMFILLVALVIWGVDFLMNLYRSAMGFN